MKKEIKISSSCLCWKIEDVINFLQKEKETIENFWWTNIYIDVNIWCWYYDHYFVDVIVTYNK